MEKTKVVEELLSCLSVYSAGFPKGCVPLGIYRVEEIKGLIDGMGTVGLQGAAGHNGSIEGQDVHSMSYNPHGKLHGQI